MLRLLLTVGRRLIAGKVSLAVEFDLRQRFYEHLQKLELAFFDTQQTGQLMSRATVDLQSIRFFLGYGLIWVSQSALTILFAAVAMFVLDPLLALLALAPVPFLVATATRYSRRNRPAEQEVQQRIGEVTAEAEESISGIRIVKAFARERHMLDRFRHSVEPGLRAEHGLHAAAVLLHAADGIPAEPRPGGRPPGWRPSGDPRPAPASAI